MTTPEQSRAEKLAKEYDEILSEVYNEMTSRFYDRSEYVDFPDIHFYHREAKMETMRRLLANHPSLSAPPQAKPELPSDEEMEIEIDKIFHAYGMFKKEIKEIIAYFRSLRKEGQ